MSNNNTNTQRSFTISTPPPHPSQSVASSSDTTELPKPLLTSAYAKHLFDDITEPTETIVISCTKPKHAELPIPGILYCSVIGHTFQQIQSAVSKYDTVVWLAHTPQWNTQIFDRLLDGRKTLFLYCTLHQIMQSTKLMKLIMDRNYSMPFVALCGPGRVCGLDHGYNTALIKLVPNSRYHTRFLSILPNVL